MYLPVAERKVTFEYLWRVYENTKSKGDGSETFLGRTMLIRIKKFLIKWKQYVKKCVHFVVSALVYKKVTMTKNLVGNMEAEVEIQRELVPKVDCMR